MMCYILGRVVEGTGGDGLQFMGGWGGNGGGGEVVGWVG